ncbi:MAG: deoxyribodipyrimidine photo-lyase [Hyphomicrobiaceae bacterium]|nr:deoxyribodipyrimidine photo-lyase [Hyphomicrobiaceae bacterium]
MKNNVASQSAQSKSPLLLWFRNDLRLADNAALAAAAARKCPVIPVFVYDEGAQGAWSPGGASRWWLHHSLSALAHALQERGSRLILRRGFAADELQKLAEETGADLVHMTRRYEPWAITQETACRSQLADAGIELKRFSGGLLVEPEAIATKAGDPYKVYTPFWRALCSSYSPARPSKAPKLLSSPKSWPQSDDLTDWGLKPINPNWASEFADFWMPGEAGADARLSAFLNDAVGAYKHARNRPDVAGTSRLSPHLAHGEISPRLVWWRIQSARAAHPEREPGLETFAKELVWREFSYHLLFHFPDLPSKPFREEFAEFTWNNDAKSTGAWQRGMTGYPIVDAGMRELWATGWMHNRVRMIVASFLIKDLLIDWRHGENWFWDTLVDADLANNSASWQWVAGSGADAAPYFRIFNPVTQGEKFDPEGAYVRRWIPEIAKLPNKYLHKPFDADEQTLANACVSLGDTYPRPIVNHAQARKVALSRFDDIKS